MSPLSLDRYHCERSCIITADMAMFSDRSSFCYHASLYVRTLLPCQVPDRGTKLVSLPSVTRKLLPLVSLWLWILHLWIYQGCPLAIWNQLCPLPHLTPHPRTRIQMFLRTPPQSRATQTTHATKHNSCSLLIQQIYKHNWPNLIY